MSHMSHFLRKVLQGTFQLQVHNLQGNNLVLCVKYMQYLEKFTLVSCYIPVYNQLVFT